MRAVVVLARRGFRRISARSRRVLVLFLISTIVICLLDGAALVLLARVFVSVNSAEPLSINEFGPSITAVVLLFSLKSPLAALAGYLATTRLADEECRIGQENLQGHLDLPWIVSRERDSSHLIRTVDQGPNALVQLTLVAMTSMLAEVVNAAVIATVLVVVNPLVAAATFAFFSISGILQHRLLSRRATSIGASLAESVSDLYSRLTDIHALTKTLTVNRSLSLTDSIGVLRSRISQRRAMSVFLPTVPRFSLELTLSLGLALIALTGYLIDGEGGAISAVVLFAAAGFRLLPVVNRIQSLIVTMVTFGPTAQLAFSTDQASPCQSHASELHRTRLLSLNRVTFRYPGTDVDIVQDVTFQIERGSHYALVGASGAGKSTVIDLCLGLLPPTTGHIEVAANLRMAYVPQETYLARSSLAENVALEWDRSCIDFDRVAEVLRMVHFTTIAADDPELLSQHSLSGGQKQRVGIARAIYRDPDLLFLDEVTSSLDSESEQDIVDLIERLRHTTTVVTIAHRLSTIRNADQVVHLHQGCIHGIGNLDELRSRSSLFKKQLERGDFDQSQA